MRKSIGRVNVKRLLMAGALVCVLVISAMLFMNTGKVYAEDAATTIQINNSADLLRYVSEYAAGQHNPDDVLQFALNQGSAFIIPSSQNFEGIGTSSRPFNGKIEIADNAISNFFLDAPLFNYVTTDTKIVNTSNVVRNLDIARISTNTDAPLFANHVVAGAVNSGADWSVTLVADNTDGSNVTSNDFAGVIGEIGAGSKVHVTFEHDSIASTGVIANVKSAGDVGLICGTLGEGAELSVDVSSNHDFTVQSTGGNAGGIVGTMAAGSKVILTDGFSSVSNVTSDAGFAGGIAGTATDAEVTVSDPTSETFTVSKTVSGSSGAGGVYGSYTCTKDNTGSAGGTRTFDLSPVKTDSSFTLAGTGDVGGVIGHLSATNNVTVTGGITLGATDNTTYDRKVNLNGGTNRGGVIGAYENSSLANVLDINSNKVQVSSNAAGSGNPAIGGVIGKILGSSPAYVKISDVAVKNTGSAAMSSALIADMNSTGSFLDTDGMIAASGSYGAGLVYNQNAGVIRLKGVTDLGGKYIGTAATTSVGQLVGTRENGLIYALGSGADSDNTTTGWTFRRGSGRVDDVGDWGEVLRLKSDYNGLAESDFFTVDMTNHTVTVSAHEASMGTIKDFIKTALNIQLNDQDRGSLKFASSASRRDTLLATNLSISADISLEKTGIVSFMRDNGSLLGYSGTFEGNNHIVTLAIGEPYGYAGTGNTALTSADRGNNNYGTVFGHRLLGLFSQTASGAEIENVTTAGYISLAANKDKRLYYAGGAVGYVGGTGAPLTLDNVTTTQQNKIFITGGSETSVHCGGAIGYVSEGTAGTVTITDCTFDNEAIETRSAGSGYFGGGIGYVASTADLTFNFDTVELSGTYDNTASTSFGSVHYGGLISYITHASNNENRKLVIKKVTVANDVSINNKTNGSARSTGSGAFLGSEWYDTKVTIGTDGSTTDGVTIGTSAAGAGPSITVASGSTNCNMAGLVYKGTGFWRVNNVKVNKAAINASNGSNKSFGFIVNDAVYTSDTERCALYLELVEDGYDIASTTVSGSPAVYDEVVAYSHFNNESIEQNGQAIVSIRPASGAAIVMDGSAINTYQNQTAYGIGTVKYNPNTRYYYNLDSIRAKASPTAGEKLLMWSVNRYAQSKIEGYFTNGFTNTITGTCDMEGLSYYPVNASGMSISDATVKFYNDKIETGEAASSGGSDSFARTTRNTVVDSTQHYLMHSGIFLNYTGDLSIDDLTLQGNVGRQNFGSGFIVVRQYGNVDETSELDIDGLVFDNCSVNDLSSYAPLIINTVGRNSKLDISDVTTTGYPDPTVPVATSMIGNVGSATATNINLKFSNMVLDSRTAALSNGTADAALTSAYGTTRSIFSRATFLESFRYLNSGSGEYNYTHDEDWGSTLHQVTYAKEVKDSVEYAGREEHYYDDPTNYTDPEHSTGTTGVYNFSSGFLPHVYHAYDLANYYHEIRVNLKQSDLTEGCGQYNDPYIIRSGGMLSAAAQIINGTPSDGVKIVLPNDMVLSTLDMWCDNRTTHTEYAYNESLTEFVPTTGSGNKGLNDVRKYLAGAYFSIATDIELPVDYIGLGTVGDWSSATDYDCPYAFRGVIVGGRNEITNTSPNPLIKASNGSVLRDVKVTVEATVTVSQTDKRTFSYDNTSCAVYSGVIGKVMGGDNIIDRVEVDYTGATITGGSTAYAKVVPVGGYVGVILNGGVIFRNMSSVSANLRSGITSTICSLAGSNEWLFVNPIIGRVLSGYAFTESTSYVYDENSVTMKNGKNNYSIPDVKVKNADSTALSNAEKMNVILDNAGLHEITVPNGQSLYLLGCIVNSGAASATKGDGTYGERAYTTSLTGNNAAWIAYRSNCCTRCAAYSDVGTPETTSSNCADYVTVAAWDKFDGSTKVPYVIKQYTLSTVKNGKTIYRARSICFGSQPSTSSITFSSDTTYDLPASFRGIGSIFYDSPYLRIPFKALNGNDAVLAFNTYYLDYDMECSASGIANRIHDNYYNAEHVGLGLFSQFYQCGVADSEDNVIKDFTITGSIYYDILHYSDGTPIEYTYGKGTDSIANSQGVKTKNNGIAEFSVLNVGGIAGTLNGAVQNRYNIRLKNVSIGNIDFTGAKSVGGLIGSCSVITYADMQVWFIGGLILNHIVSAVDAAITANAHNKVLYEED
ncbi:MAG: hypothetical protein IKN38_08305, partial [Clostridia bacterium]|nr:hypothetical protein [Clostridia bacterium]